MTDKETKRISKFLSYVLRHHPELIGLELDAAGWANVNALLLKAPGAGVAMDMPALLHVVSSNDKQRFKLNDDQTRIRASQGHSIAIDSGYKPSTPPALLFHGTGNKYLKNILADGLLKKARQHVHLSRDRKTALSVGSRHGKSYVFQVAALEMHNDGYAFYLSDNGVWLTEHVPAKYLG